MSIFYDRQTDSCYLLCERYYYEEELKNIKQILDQIIKFYKNRTIKVKAPTLRLSFNNYKDLNNKIEELANRNFIKIEYMSNLLNYVCILQVYFSYDTIKKRKLCPESYFDNYDFTKLVQHKIFHNKGIMAKSNSMNCPTFDHYADYTHCNTSQAFVKSRDSLDYI